MMEPPQKWVVVRTPWKSSNVKSIHRVAPKTNTGCVCVLGFGYILLWQKKRKQCRKEMWTAEHTNNQTNVTLHKFQCDGKKLWVKIQHVGNTGYKSVQPNMGFIQSPPNTATKSELSLHPVVLQILDTVNSFSMHNVLYVITKRKLSTDSTTKYIFFAIQCWYFTSLNMSPDYCRFLNLKPRIFVYTWYI